MLQVKLALQTDFQCFAAVGRQRQVGVPGVVEGVFRFLLSRMLTFESMMATGNLPDLNILSSHPVLNRTCFNQRRVLAVFRAHRSPIPFSILFPSIRQGVLDKPVDAPPEPPFVAIWSSHQRRIKQTNKS
jgi:hypothetical protein